MPLLPGNSINSINVEVGKTRVTTVQKTTSTNVSLDSVVIGVGGSGDKHYTHNQIAAEDQWSVTHNLGKYPSVSIVDSGGSVVIGEVMHIDENSLLILFSAAFSGKAFLN